MTIATVVTGFLMLKLERNTLEASLYFAAVANAAVGAISTSWSFRKLEFG
jgi:hypothetical protein